MDQAQVGVHALNLEFSVSSSLIRASFTEAESAILGFPVVEGRIADAVARDKCLGPSDPAPVC